MNLLQRISLCLLKLAVHKQSRLTESQDSIATPLGHVPYKRSCVVKSQAWTPSVSARWYDEREQER